MKDNGIELVQKAYNLLESITPLALDCGRLCNHLCCNGNDKGMLLFPYEDEIISKYSNFKIVEDNGNNICFCDGSCDRKVRPLSCRIFPYFPVINSDGTYDVRSDIRGISLCPLLYNNMNVRKDFIFNVRRVGRLLSRNEKLKEFINDINNYIDCVTEFAEIDL